MNKGTILQTWAKHRKWRSTGHDLPSTIFNTYLIMFSERISDDDLIMVDDNWSDSYHEIQNESVCHWSFNFGSFPYPLSIMKKMVG